MADGGLAPPKLRKPRKKASRQDYGTPLEFMAALEMRFGRFDYDLAAHADNAKAPLYLDPIDDSLSRDWSELEGLAYLNPPFEDIYPWAERCARFASPRLRIVALWLASVDANWFTDHVLTNAISNGVTRMQFEGADQGYPKPLMISAFGFGASGFGPVFKWRELLKSRSR